MSGKRLWSLEGLRSPDRLDPACTFDSGPRPCSLTTIAATGITPPRAPAWLTESGSGSR